VQVNPKTNSFFALAAALALFVQVSPARADASKAAQDFDAGVRFFDAAEYPAAARAFLRADQLAPNSEAVANAITSALKTTDHLLVVEAAMRGVARAGDDTALAAKARQALAKARVHLAELELSCAPQPCRLELDGVEAPPGAHFVLPGTHSVIARDGEGMLMAERSQSFEVGTRYRLELRPTPAATEPKENPAASSASPPEESAGAISEGRTDAAEAPPPAPATVSPTWFYVSAGVTAVLAGFTVWSAVDTLSLRSSLGDSAPSGDIERLKRRRLRTDLLLGGALLAGGATTYIGLELVDWQGGHALADAPRGAVLTWHGTF
jgi:hypothetical protein